MRRTSLFILFCYFFVSAHLYGDYHIPPGNEPPRDPIQEGLDRCGQTRGPSPELLGSVQKNHLENLELRNVCAECYSPEQTVKNFCFNKKAKGYIEFDVDFSSPESSLKTAQDLRSQIDAKSRGHKLRKYCIRPVNKKRHRAYFDNKVDDYIKQLKPVVEQRRIQSMREQRKKNYKEILEAHRSQALGGDDLAKQKLVDYGEKLIEKIDANDVSREKFDCVIKTLQNNGVVCEKRYGNGEKLRDNGREYGIYPNDIEIFSGNDLQHYFHEQVVKNLDRSFAIYPSCGRRSLVRRPGDLKTLSIGSLKSAYAANVSHEYELADAAIGFTDSLLYFAKRAGSGIAKGGIDFGRAVSFMLGSSELPRDTSSISEIFAKIKEQPLEGIGDGLEHAVRTLTFGGAVFVSYLLGLEVAAVGAAAVKGLVGAAKFLEPFSVGISPSGAATLEYNFAGAKDFAIAAVITVGQAAQGVCEVAEQCSHLFAAGNGGTPGGEKNKVLGRGSTADLSKGTTLPRNLEEQLAIQEAMADPASGFELPLEMTDTRWPSSDGWIKMQYIHHIRDGKINVHYVYNKVTGMVDDFKIKL